MSDFDRDTLTLNLIYIYHQKIFTIESYKIVVYDKSVFKTNENKT